MPPLERRSVVRNAMFLAAAWLWTAAGAAFVFLYPLGQYQSKTLAAHDGAGAAILTIAVCGAAMIGTIDLVVRRLRKISGPGVAAICAGGLLVLFSFFGLILGLLSVGTIGFFIVLSGGEMPAVSSGDHNADVSSKVKLSARLQRSVVAAMKPGAPSTPVALVVVGILAACALAVAALWLPWASASSGVAERVEFTGGSMTMSIVISALAAGAVWLGLLLWKVPGASLALVAFSALAMIFAVVLALRSISSANSLANTMASDTMESVTSYGYGSAIGVAAGLALATSSVLHLALAMSTGRSTTTPSDAVRQP